MQRQHETVAQISGLCSYCLICCQSIHVGPPTPIFLSFQFMVSWRSNASLVRASNLVWIRWFSWRGAMPRWHQREQEQEKSEWKKDWRNKNTHPYRYNNEETRETEWDDTEQRCCSCWERNDGTEVKASGDQFERIFTQTDRPSRHC